MKIRLVSVWSAVNEAIRGSNKPFFNSVLCDLSVTFNICTYTISVLFYTKCFEEREHFGYAFTIFFDPPLFFGTPEFLRQSDNLNWIDGKISTDNFASRPFLDTFSWGNLTLWEFVWSQIQFIGETWEILSSNSGQSNSNEWFEFRRAKHTRWS